MFVRKTTSPNTKKTAIQIVESKREGKKVRQRILRHVGSAEHPDDIERLYKLAEAEFSLLRHIKTRELYALPSSLLPLAKKLYRIVGLKPSTAPYKI